MAASREVQNLSSQMNHDLLEPINSIRRKLELLETTMEARPPSAAAKKDTDEYISAIRSLCSGIIQRIRKLRNDVRDNKIDDARFQSRLASIIDWTASLASTAARTPSYQYGESLTGQIRATASRYQKMLRALLTVASTSTPSFQPTNFKNQAHIAAGYVLERLPSDLSGPNSPGIFFWTDTRASGSADQGMILTIFQNIYENAVKYRSRDRVLQIKTWFQELSYLELERQFSDYIHLIPRSPKYVVISIEDNGIGIPPEGLQKIFDPYVQLPSGRPGRRGWPDPEGVAEDVKDAGDVKDVGIGLYTVRKLVAAHHGYVLVRSDGSTGSTFVVILPEAPRAIMQV